MAKTRKLDIFAVLRAIDQRQGDWLSQQSEDAKKEFAPIVATRWAAGVQGSADALYMLWQINQRVNHRLFEQEPDLTYRLLASCGLRRSFKRDWLAPPCTQPIDNAAYRLLLEQHPGANDEELQMILSSYTRKEFAELVVDCGKSKDEAKACLDAFKKLRDRM